MSETFYLKGFTLPYRLYNKYEWKDDILYLYYNEKGSQRCDTLSKKDIIETEHIPVSNNNDLYNFILEIKYGKSTPEKLTPENNELIEIFKDGNGTPLDFDVGTKVYLDEYTIYDKDNMYIITKKYGPFKTVSVTKTSGYSFADDKIIYKYDLQNINEENKTIEKAFNVFEAKNLELDGVLYKKKIDGEINEKKIKQNINDEIDGKTDKIDGKTIKKIVKDEGKYIFTGADNHTSGYEPEFPKKHLITFDNDEQEEFKGDVNEINGNNQNAGKRKSRRTRKTKKGKRSRKARKSRRKSRRKSNRRRGRR